MPLPLTSTMASAEETRAARNRPPDQTDAPQVVALARSRTDRLIRYLNVLVAVVGLILTLPLWLLIAVLIKLTSRGPVFYTQTRVGLDRRGRIMPLDLSRRRDDVGGLPFTIVKFRTMRVDAEPEGKAVWAQAKDARLTLVGGFLRSCRLDELPQLLNVVRGDMNLVGPRPERPELFAELRQQIPDYPRRQRVPPGITGHAQVHLQYDTSVDDVKRKLSHDLEYIERRTVWQDIQIMIKTIPVMLFRRGGW
jgi:lipopolysaccharide/colanic/teichoic acid biosynthesis glycosyltransferase